MIELVVPKNPPMPKHEAEEDMYESVKRVHELIEDEIAKGIDPDRIIISGFSQGACGPSPVFGSRCEGSGRKKTDEKSSGRVRHLALDGALDAAQTRRSHVPLGLATHGLQDQKQEASRELRFLG